MSKTKKKRIEKRIIEEMHLEVLRGNTWVGCRPTVFNSKKDKKKDRRTAKQSIRAYVGY